MRGTLTKKAREGEYAVRSLGVRPSGSGEERGKRLAPTGKHDTKKKEKRKMSLPLAQVAKKLPKDTSALQKSSMGSLVSVA